MSILVSFIIYLYINILSHIFLHLDKIELLSLLLFSIWGG